MTFGMKWQETSLDEQLDPGWTVVQLDTRHLPLDHT